MTERQARRASPWWHGWKPHICLFLATLCLGANGHAASKAKPEEELQELRSRIEQLQRDLTAKEESRAEASDALKESEQAISEVNRRLYGLTAEQRVAQAEVATLDGQIRVLEKQIAAEKSRIEKMLQNRYLSGGQDTLKMILNGQDPAAVARQLHYYGYISRARAELVERVKGDVDSLALLKAESLKKADEISRMKDEEAQGKKALEAEQAKRKQVLAKLSVQISGQRKEIKRLQQNETRLTRLVEEINRLLAKRRAQEAKRRADEARKRAQAEAKAGKKAAPAERNEEVADDSLAGKAFTSLKGRLKLPVRGELVNRFGSPRDSGGPSWKGLFIRAETGQMVRAVADGRVVFADWLRGFGNLLILDHGGGYMSLYGYNETLLKTVGELIKSGDTIAQVGNTGGNQDSGLYFELRYQSRPLDPLGWVAR